LINVSVVKQFANKCYRTLLVAYVDYDVNEWETLKRNNNNFESETDRETVENNLVLVGIFGLMDPLRPGIKEAIAQC
jgi:Ca2+-transporting ATPase